jgi:hypothetical protein
MRWNQPPPAEKINRQPDQLRRLLAAQAGNPEPQTRHGD